MADLKERLADAKAALATLEEAVPRTSHSLIERDSAIFRLIYTFAVVSDACRDLLAERDGLEAGSANATIRAAQRLGWLSDEDAKAAMQAGRDRELAFEMYRPGVGDEIASRLESHVMVLRCWLDSLQRCATASG